ADRFLPAKTPQSVLDAHQFQARGGIGLAVASRSDRAVAEIALGRTHTAHLEAFAQLRVEALTDDEFGTAAANINHQTLAGPTRKGVGDAEINQSRLFPAGDDFDLMIDD